MFSRLLHKTIHDGKPETIQQSRHVYIYIYISHKQTPKQHQHYTKASSNLRLPILLGQRFIIRISADKLLSKASLNTTDSASGPRNLTNSIRRGRTFALANNFMSTGNLESTSNLVLA
jgi:hypothetical protein